MIKVFEEMDFSEDDKEVYVDDVSVTYCQSGDCTEDSDEVQTLVVSSRNNGMSRFINLKTENWSVDGIKDLENIINDFSERAGIKNDKKDE